MRGVINRELPGFRKISNQLFGMNEGGSICALASKHKVELFQLGTTIEKLAEVNVCEAFDHVIGLSFLNSCVWAVICSDKKKSLQIFNI